MCMAGGSGHRDYSSIKKGSIGQPGGTLFAQQGDRQRLVADLPERKPLKTMFAQSGDAQALRPTDKSGTRTAVTLFPQQGDQRDPRTAILGPSKGKTVLGT